jgi:hypothetical protein
VGGGNVFSPALNLVIALKFGILFWGAFMSAIAVSARLARLDSPERQTHDRT